MERDAPTYEHLRARAGIVAYPTREWGECVWAYLGPAEAMPPLPDLEFALVDPAHRYVSKKLQECNWAQSAEGGIDTAHFSFLHAPVGEEAMARLPPAYGEQVRWMQADGAPRYTVVEHDAGLILAGGRRADDGETYWRIAQYLMPNHSLAPGGMAGQTNHGQTWVPIDDTSCWIFTYSWNPDRPLSEGERAAYAAGGAVHAEVDAHYAPIRRRANDYLIDREAAEARELHRHQGHLRAGPGDPGQPGPDPRPHPRDAGSDRPRRLQLPRADAGRRARPGGRDGASRGDEPGRLPGPLRPDRRAGRACLRRGDGAPLRPPEGPVRPGRRASGRGGVTASNFG